MMVGGNIRFQTRVLTTSIVLETSKGNFDMAIALGVLLLVITFLVNWALTVIQQRGVLDAIWRVIFESMYHENKKK